MHATLITDQILDFNHQNLPTASKSCSIMSLVVSTRLVILTGSTLDVQGCAEIRWLAEKMGAKSSTVSGLSGLGDIMLTCYGSLSRNR